MQQIKFNTKGYDGFIDFIKSYCILVVIFCHGFPYLDKIGYAIWGVQIPLFFLIQVFHCYKREAKPINWKKIGQRIVLPFVIVEAFVLGVKLVNGGGQNIALLLKEGLVGGGYGPGSYYPWIYLQMAILIPLMRPMCEKLGKWWSLVVFVLFCEAIEIVCSITNLPDSVYRLLCLRYIFLIWVGWLWAKEGIKLNMMTSALSILSLTAIIYLVFYNRDLEPWLFNTEWLTHRWICYFWVSWLFVGFLHCLYSIFVKYEIISTIIKKLAFASYEIFLIQMAYFALLPLRSFDFIGNAVAQFAIWFALAFIVSVSGGIMASRLRDEVIR